MDRLAQLEFETFVPAHFGHGRKEHLLEYIAYQRDARRLACPALQRQPRGLSGG